MKIMFHLTKALGVVAIICGLAGCGIFKSAQQNDAGTNVPTGKPLNEEATAAAWDALNAGNYAKAITNANQCIDEFRASARQLEEKLESDKPDLPTGAVNHDLKMKLFANGLLNDVAACYFIVGKASEKLGKTDDAKRAYLEAKNLTYARVWDPHGWFWSPAEAARDRLHALQETH